MWGKLFATCFVAVFLQACNGEGSGNQPDNGVAQAPPPPLPPPPAQGNDLDAELRALISQHNLTGDPSAGRILPPVGNPVAQLGKKLFFSKALGGEFDSACASCHHPALGGADALSLPVGVGAIDPDLLGPGRGNASGIANISRNAPTTFNVGLWDSALFFDSRVESLGKEAGQNGAASGISTPDSGTGRLDSNAGANLVVAQARFPVTSVEEMRGGLELGQPNNVVRAHLAARIGSYGVGAGELRGSTWLNEFQAAFSSAESAEQLITFRNIARAIGAYQRSQIFVNSPWRAYVQGDNGAISDIAKEGAILFYTDANEGGAACAECHSGDFFTDGSHHTVGAPQFGPGKGNGVDGSSDFGRENATGAANDRFRFRTPSLLNVAVTAPYMHTGAYASLPQVLRHYDNPRGEADDFFDDGGWCQLEQFQLVGNCGSLYPSARRNTEQALDKIQSERDANDPDALPNINLNNNERNQIVLFLQTLTDPCVLDRACLAPWIPTDNEAADDHQLNAVDFTGSPL